MRIDNTFNFGVRLDEGCVGDVREKVWLAHQLYNDLVGAMRKIHDELQLWTLEQGGDVTKAIYSKVVASQEHFASAKAANDEAGMKSAAEDRRTARRELAIAFKEIRNKYKDEVRDKFYSRIGNKTGTETYQIRCDYADKGLGFATSTDVLDRALKAWSDSMKQGKPPMFSKASEKIQDTLVLQFTKGGGLSRDEVFGGKSKEFSISAKPGARSYGTFSFRLGAAKEKKYATGEIQFHRDLPENARISGAVLVVKKVADKHKYWVQLTTNYEADVVSATGKKPFLAIHLGWNADEEGRRIAGVSESPDASCAEIIQLPIEIEAGLSRAAEFKSQRDSMLNELVGKLGEWPLTGDEGIDTEIGKLQKLPATHIAQSRLHRLIHKSWARGFEGEFQPAWLREWKSKDRKLWQAEVGMARKARARRKKFYELLALEWCGNYQAIVLEKPDLKKAAKKVDDKTGERSEFTKKARAGRQIAALYELVSAIKWQAKKLGVALFEENAATVSHCSHCGEPTVTAKPDDHQVLLCSSCGAVTDRKANGAAVLYQVSATGMEERIKQFHIDEGKKQLAALQKKTDRLKKMQEVRRTKQQAGANP